MEAMQGEGNANLLDCNEINKQLEASKISNYHVIVLSKVNSTNSYVLEHIDELKNNSIITTDLQTNGRGRYDRKWNSVSGIGLTVSFLKFVPIRVKLTLLPLVASIAINRLFNDLAIENYLKWPNDLCDSSANKIVGILVESGVSKGRRFGVFGFGISNHYGINRNFFCAKLIYYYDQVLNEYFNNGFDNLKLEWQSNCIHWQQTVGLYNEERLIVTGKNIGINNDGAILIQQSSGEVSSFVNGTLRFCFK